MNYWPKGIWIFSNMFYGESHMHEIIWSFSLEILICYSIKLSTRENHASECGKRHIRCLVVTEQAFQPSHWMCSAPFPLGVAQVVLGVVVCRRFSYLFFSFSFFCLSFQKMQVCHLFVCFFNFNLYFFDIWFFFLTFLYKNYLFLI